MRRLISRLLPVLLQWDISRTLQAKFLRRFFFFLHSLDWTASKDFHRRIPREPVNPDLLHEQRDHLNVNQTELLIKSIQSVLNTWRHKEASRPTRSTSRSSRGGAKENNQMLDFLHSGSDQSRFIRKTTTTTERMSSFKTRRDISWPHLTLLSLQRRRQTESPHPRRKQTC